jgi:dTDP-4-amino-4,6-dideoxygalactose transaminase
VASYGALSALSFHATKNLSSGEGGALIVNDASLLHRAEMVREKGTDRSRFLRGEVDKYTWRCVGSSYLMSDLNAAVLLAQLESFEEIQAHRHTVWSTYRSALEPVSARLGLSLQQIDAADGHPAHLFGMLLPLGVERAPLLAAMAEAGVRATSHYEPLHSAPAHGGAEALPVSDGVASRMVRLPIHGEISADEASRIAALLVSLLERDGSGGKP